MAATTRLEGQLDAGLAYVQRHRFAHVADAEEVGAGAGDHLEQLREAAGTVRDAGEDTYAPALRGFVTQQQRRQQPAVDVSARDDRDGRPRHGRQAPVEQRRDRHRAGALRHQLRVFGEEHHRLGRAARATARPWLPALAVTRPGAARSPSAATLLRAPRSLNEPVACRHSAFSATAVSAASDRLALAIVGVRTTSASTARRAPSRSALAISSAGFTVVKV